MHTNECKLKIPGSDMTPTTSIDEASRSAVRKDGCTVALEVAPPTYKKPPQAEHKARVETAVAALQTRVRAVLDEFLAEFKAR